MGKKRRLKPTNKHRRTNDQHKKPNIQHHYTGQGDDASVLFSFERVVDGDFCFSKLEEKQKADVADSIFKRKSFTWNDLRNAPRHGLGTEKIQKSSILAPIPDFITEDKNYFLALRFSGKAPMVGYRVGQIFYILWFDPNMKLYKHE